MFRGDGESWIEMSRQFQRHTLVGWGNHRASVCDVEPGDVIGSGTVIRMSVN
jgi:hypothetical protein